MIRPHHIAQIPTLNDQQKAHWKEGLTKLWATVDNPQADPETKQKAIAKIKDVSKELMMNIAKWKASQAQQAGRPPSQGQQPQQAQQSQQEQQQNQSQPQQPQQQSQQQPQQQQPAQQQGQGQGQQQGYQMSEQAKSFLRGHIIYPSQSMNASGPEWEAYKQRAMRMMQTAIMQQDNAAQRLTHYNRRKAAFQTQGQEMPADLVQAINETETAMNQAKASVSRLKLENERNKEAFQAKQKEAAQNNTGGDAGSPNGAVSQTQMPNQMQAQQQVRQQQPQNAAQAMYNAAVGGNTQGQQTGGPSAMSPATGTPQGFPPQNQGAMQNQSQQQQQQQQQQQTPQQQQQQPTMPMTQQQQPSAGMPGRPLPNPQQAYAQQQQQQQQHQTPATPMSANNQQGPPQALSHQAAMSAVARTYSEQAARSTPVATTPGANFPSINNAINNPNAKMPIPKTLNVPSPSPVAMGPARPTFGGGAPQNMMGAPAIVKPPGFELEGGERVLSKKKLDELVRQVTGGGENDGLTPEVEEVCLLILSAPDLLLVH